MILTTTVIHATAMSILLWWLKVRNAAHWGPRSQWTRTLLVSASVLFLFLASLVEVGVWGLAYLLAGAFSELEPALYFSMVTFTSLGYGDVVLSPTWRLLGSFQAANGIIMFGWTTALIFLFVQRLYFTPKA